MSGNDSSPGTYTYVCVFSFRTVSQGHPNWKVTKEKGVIMVSITEMIVPIFTR